MTNLEASVTLRLSIQRALLDEVTDRMWSITCGLRERTVMIRAYFQGAVTPEDLERVQRIGTEVIADFPDGYMIEESCGSLDELEEISLDYWVFRRAPK